MVYIVSVDYIKFEFMNGPTALSFAELALGASVDNTRHVEIEIKALPNFNELQDDVAEALDEEEEEDE